jgi:hypothetical protein
MSASDSALIELVRAIAAGDTARPSKLLAASPQSARVADCPGLRFAPSHLRLPNAHDSHPNNKPLI